MFDWIKNKTYKYRKDIGKYNFYVKHEPEHIDSSTTLTLTTYTNHSQTATIPCRYRWSIIKNGLTIQVPEFKGSSFKCQPSDIGSLIQAQIISNDPEYSGTAVIQFGPVKLDVTLKKQIQQALSTGCATMPVYLISNGEQKQCQIRLYQDVIKINHAYSQNNYTFDYSIFEPRIECISKDSSRIVIVFNEKYQTELRRFTKKLFDDQYNSKDLSSSSRSNQSTNSSQSPKLDIKFMHRNSRDIFLFAMKAFNTKKQLRSSVIINKIQKIDFTDHDTFDYILQIENLRSEMVKMDQVVKRAHQEKLKYYNEIAKLEKEIEEIIITYTRIVEEKFQNQAEFSRDYSMLSAKRDEILAKKYKNLQNENNHLNSRIQTLAKEIDNIRFKPTPTISAPLVGISSPQQQDKIYFNYENQNYNNAFTKKKTQQPDASGFVNILDQLGESRISYISSVKQEGELQCKLDQVQKQKQQLQKKLQMSFHKIDSLQKQLYLQKQHHSSSKHQKLNSSAIHFTYNSHDPIFNNNHHQTQSIHNISAIFDREKESLIFENNQLKKNNQILLTEKRKLIEELKRPIQLNGQKYQQQDNLNNSGEQKFKNLIQPMNHLKTHKKESISSDKQRDLMQTISKKDSYIKLLKMQNEQLKKTNQTLRKNLQSAKNSSIDQQKLIRRIGQLEEEIDMYRKNADALNRSQHLSMQMDNYNEEQIQMLKQHNQFLTTENQKLAKACQKYMGDAKETNKLRMEIIKLKQKVNQLQSMNTSSVLVA